ncbi:MAG: hypothetical protein LBC88_08360, partial [Spirochaetaceae bacterium]|nr:hypothetical protein [Spirochaetaceae bacterium]
TAYTYETVRTKASEERDTFTTSIGSHNEPAGWYRYAFFTTTDVYNNPVKVSYPVWMARLYKTV